MRLKNKVALITGAAQGIGLGIAQRFFAEGATVYLCDLNEDAGKKALKQFSSRRPRRAFFLKLDVTSEASWVEAFARVMARSGRLDILVNNAGINIRQSIEEMPVKNLEAMLAVNVKGPFLGIKQALPLLRKNGGGSIINISSICGLIGHQYTNEAYTTTKGALTLLTKSVAVRYAKDNIRANSIHPSTVDTPLVRELFRDPARKQERLGEVPLGRLATTEDVAAAALFMASAEGAFLNGVALPVDGGLTA
ncbi:MAG TPA: SDR family oxidoreductase [Opitutaceae bacterium]|nr:SDR family oxidoreductase [Opitutaceae bacterium]